jgi:hypothetical protein
LSKFKEWFQGPENITKAEAVEDYAVGRDRVDIVGRYQP